MDHRKQLNLYFENYKSGKISLHELRNEATKMANELHLDDKPKLTCSCGTTFLLQNVAKHMASKKHKKFIFAREINT